MGDSISRQALLAEYDRLHVGEPGRARKMIEDAPPAQLEPCGEMVSREVVVKFFDDWMSALDINCHHQSVADLRIIKGDIKNLPSAQPEQRWIPCSERLPEDGLYLVTTSKGQVQAHVFSHNGNSEEYWMRCNKAWMELPEPYKGKE